MKNTTVLLVNLLIGFIVVSWLQPLDEASSTMVMLICIAIGFSVKFVLSIVVSAWKRYNSPTKFDLF